VEGDIALLKQLRAEVKVIGMLPIDHEQVRSVAELAETLGNCIVVRKGVFDLITDGK